MMKCMGTPMFMRAMKEMAMCVKGMMKKTIMDACPASSMSLPPSSAMCAVAMNGICGTVAAISCGIHCAVECRRMMAQDQPMMTTMMMMAMCETVALESAALLDCCKQMVREGMGSCASGPHNGIMGCMATYASCCAITLVQRPPEQVQCGAMLMQDQRLALMKCAQMKVMASELLCETLACTPDMMQRGCDALLSKCEKAMPEMCSSVKEEPKQELGAKMTVGKMRKAMCVHGENMRKCCAAGIRQICQKASQSDMKQMNACIDALCLTDQICCGEGKMKAVVPITPRTVH